MACQFSVIVLSKCPPPADAIMQRIMNAVAPEVEIVCSAEQGGLVGSPEKLACPTVVIVTAGVLVKFSGKVMVALLKSEPEGGTLIVPHSSSVPSGRWT